MLTPSLRRVYTSRAFLIAISASGACRLPTCLCASPCCERMKISHNGHSDRSIVSAPLRSLRRLLRAGCAFFRVGERRLPNPRALFPRLDARPQPISIARPIALDHVVELVPIDRTEIVMPTLAVPLELGIRYGDAEIIRLRHGLIDEALPQLVVGQNLDLPLRRLRAVHGISVGRAEHHQRWPPPAVQRILSHRLLLG